MIDVGFRIGAVKLLSISSLIFWDFDGVIKDSIEVKSTAFEELFLPFGRDVAERIRQHHQEYGGVSRFQKIPLYLEWVGETITDSIVADYCERFAALAMRGVIDSPWVPGVREFLSEFHQEKYFVLVTATPQTEIQMIIDALGIANCFREVHGAPKPKADVIGEVLGRLRSDRNRALMVGDSENDLIAAKVNSIPFLLRQTQFNRSLQCSFVGPMFTDLTNE